MERKVRYTNVSIPEEIGQGIDEYIKKHPKLGFRSRAQFVLQSIRKVLMED